MIAPVYGVSEVVITREKLYPVVSRPGPAWRWNYSYSADGAPAITYGTSLVSLRSMLQRKFVGAAILNGWKV